MKEYDLFIKYFSSTRIERYLSATNLNEKSCITLYKSNLNIAKAFHPILGIFEVILRNEINKVLSKHFNDSDWIINQQVEFMSDSTLSYINLSNGKIIYNRYILNAVKASVAKLTSKSIVINSNRLIAEQSLSFWTELFEKKYYKLLKGRPIKIFNTLPENIGRVEILNNLTKIRKFRNRINHNEPICFKGNSVDFNIPIEVYNSILNILKWINPETILLLQDIDKVLLTINNIINESYE